MSVLLQEYDPTRGESRFGCAVSVKGPASWCRWRNLLPGCLSGVPGASKARRGWEAGPGVGAGCQEDAWSEFLYAWYCYVSEGAGGEEGIGRGKYTSFSRSSAVHSLQKQGGGLSSGSSNFCGYKQHTPACAPLLSIVFSKEKPVGAGCSCHMLIMCVDIFGCLCCALRVSLRFPHKFPSSFE